MNIKEIKEKIKDLNEQISILNSTKFKLAEMLRTKESLIWIEENNVKKEYVVSSAFNDVMPYFTTIFTFNAWCRTNTNKQFIEWNGLIYNSQELYDSGMVKQFAPGQYTDLK